MSHVTPDEIVKAVARSWGYSVELVRAGGGAPLNRQERRMRLEARMVAAYLIRRHTASNRQQTCWALALPHGRDAWDLLDAAWIVIPIQAGVDPAMAKRMERAEARIDDLHERRMWEREADAGQRGRILSDMRASA